MSFWSVINRMSVYLISLVEKDKLAWDRLSKRWPDRHHIVNDMLAFVVPPGVSTVQDVRDELGISTEPDAPVGIVVLLDLYSGALDTNTVEWLNAAQHE